MKSKTSWREKLNRDKGLPKVVKIPPRMAERRGKGTLVVAAPREVDALMRNVPKGKVTTINDIRAALARKYNATLGCPMTTGIFARIAAEAAAEAEAKGKKRITPYWRTLKTGGELNPKYPGGVKEQKRRLNREGHRLVVVGNKVCVRDYEKVLAKLS